MRIQKITTNALLGSALVSSLSFSTISQATTPEQIVEQYSDIAHATYEDALISAKALQQSINLLLAEPNETTLADARSRWKAARVPYQQSEVFRFGNAIVDDWEGQLNAWPLDEGLIDYVAESNYHFELGNPGALANIIAATELTVGGETLDLTTITPELLAELNELGGSEANVATGYHAIEFLLWGQDLNETSAGAGQRPYTDYVQGAGCTAGHCDRRGQYLSAATELLISDLAEMEAQWRTGQADNYRAELLAEDSTQGLRKMLFGMGSLSLGELAGERMKVALEANSPEDEHDCFSDNTHNSHYYNGLGIRNVYTGHYQRIDGSVVAGASLADMTAQKDAQAATEIMQRFDAATAALQALVDSAENEGQAFDQMIAANNTAGNALVEQAIDALVQQTIAIEQVAALAEIEHLNPDTADHQF